MKNTVELLTEKNNLLSAQQQRIQAKYMAILDRTLLNFYAGQDINYNHNAIHIILWKRRKLSLLQQ